MCSSVGSLLGLLFLRLASYLYPPNYDPFDARCLAKASCDVFRRKNPVSNAASELVGSFILLQVVTIDYN